MEQLKREQMEQIEFAISLLKLRILLSESVEEQEKMREMIKTMEDWYSAIKEEDMEKYMECVDKAQSLMSILN